MHLPETTVELLGPSGDRRETHLLPLVDDADVEQILDRLRQVIGSSSDLALLEDLCLTVGDISTYAPSQDGTLTIASDQTFVDYFKHYRRHHGLQPDKHSSACTLEQESRTRCAADANLAETTIVAGPAHIRLFRTLRVPDNGREYPLPPGLGTFPLVPVRGHAEQLPEEITARGGLLMPMYQSEALWMSFVGSSACAIKVYAGGVNAITGRRADDEREDGGQDYVAVPQQPWLDGFCTGDGAVRQFVAAPLGEGYTVAEQLGARPDEGSIQLDVYPCLASSVSCMDAHGRFLELSVTPAEAGLSESATLSMRAALPRVKTLGEYKQRVGPVVRAVVNNRMTIAIDLLIRHSLTTWALTVNVRPTDTIGNVKAQICAQKGVAPASQRILLDRVPLDDSASLFQCEIVPDTVLHLDMNTRRSDTSGQRMGMAPGGVIAQKVYEDIQDPSVYDEHDIERVFIHTVSSRAWEFITGTVSPSDALSPATYTKHRLPWYRLYDEAVPGLRTSGAFDGLRSLQHLLGGAPAGPALCPAHSRLAVAVARPCGHRVCADCRAASGSTCVRPGCGQHVALLARLATNEGAEDMPHDVHDHRVTSLLLAADGLAPTIACRA